ncbi:hypothetical protein [Glycomyces harbinensis]|uniref:Uncharacterized protein n=1 Tax=Glycomyces harbinensis TaxID=58114 RepID=A0A1G7A8Y6_9ACTN|nr:hypothetical protein [Glycomyces harbinensis]SDE11289.1 hypothetical protein SAMN05216270_1138 [Glycomyces harbinensis]
MSPRSIELATRIALVAMGLFTAVPVLSLIQPGQLESGYGIVDPDPMLLTLLQHRGVFQALAGAALVWAAARPDVRIPVAAGVIVAKTTALVLTVSRPQAQAQADPFIQGFDVFCVLALALIIAGTARGTWALGLRRHRGGGRAVERRRRFV